MYSYEELIDDVNYLSRIGAKIGAIGASRYGRDIPFVRIGATGGDRVIVTAAIHAREHVSALFAVKQIYKLIREPLPCEIYFVPMVNPDGNVLVRGGAGEFPDPARLIGLNGGKSDFSLWKANAAGVDLNVNFDARWGEGAQNTRTAGSENYIGEAPFSEPESRALAEFTRKISPVLTLSYHAKGQEIYYDFWQTGEAKKRDKAIAELAAEITGYRLIEGTRGSAGGYKDWCVGELGIPALTLELVSDDYSHPLPDSSINPDFARGARLPAILYEFIRERGYFARE